MELILNTFGTSLSRDTDGFLIISQDSTQRIPCDGIKSIQISRGAQITSDAVLLAIEKEIDILFVDRSGIPQGRVWSPKYGSVSTIRKGQLTFSYSKDAIEWIKDVISRKIDNQQAMLLLLQPEDLSLKLEVKTAISRLDECKCKVSGLQGEMMDDVASSIRGYEGFASKIYFDAMNMFLPEELRFATRSQHPAMDVVNAMLNYAYGILYGKVEGALIKAGIDPYIGILHRDEYNRPVLVYDVIEVYRVWADYVVYTLASRNSITNDYYSTKDDGSCWLETLGRRVLIQSMIDYLEETMTVNGVTRSRAQHVVLEAQSLAQKFKKYELK